MEPPEPLVQFEAVSYLYPRATRPALRNISLDIRRGEFVGLIGATGAGKTTLCLTLNGIVPQFYGGRFFGRITVAGMDTLEHPTGMLARYVGMVFQDPETQLIANSVEDEVAFALENLQVPREEIRARITYVLQAVRLDGYERKHPSELSGGQKQRLAIAAALAMRPALLVLDEPTSQLDPVGEQEVFAVADELNRELGVTVLMASHAAERLAEYATRLILLSAGSLVAVGSPDEIYPQIELLERHHLRPPQVARTFYLINKAGHPTGRLPVRLEDGLRALDSLCAQCTLTPPSIPPEPQGADGPALVSARDLKYTYPDGTRALNGVSLDIRAGEYVVIIGQNGAGKTTLIKHFLRLLEPTEGKVLIGGRDTREFTVGELARRVGYVGQNPDHQIFNASVKDEVSFALRHLGYPAAEIRARTSASLEALGLLDMQDMHPLALTRGDRARVVLAAVLALQPEVIILDEPTTGQDYRGAKSILDITRELHRQGKTVIVVTHHLYLMPEYARRVLVMGKGTLLLDAPLRQAYHQLDVLGATFLEPPQAVLLSRYLERYSAGELRLLTPEEVAACFIPGGVERGSHQIPESVA
ncbi:MAG: energy-coupling factor transporter ATPase [Anaerolineae bacterium]|nr:energy-coupling factor transporter ATPase [Anaerolineae bacterium]